MIHRQREADDVHVPRHLLDLVVGKPHGPIPHPDGIHVQHVGEALGREGVEGVGEERVVHARGQVQDGVLRVEHVLGLLGEGPGEDVERVLALRGVGDEVALGGELGELVGLHLGVRVGVCVRVVDGEVCLGEEALGGVGAEGDARGELGEDEDGGGVGDEGVEGGGAEVGGAWVGDGEAVLETLESVEELIPLGLREVFVGIVRVARVADVDDDELLVLCREGVDLVDDVGELLPVAAHPDVLEGRVVACLPLAAGEHGAHVEVARARDELVVDVEHLRLAVGKVRADGARVERGHARVVRARHADLLERAIAERPQALVHPVGEVACVGPPVAELVGADDVRHGMVVAEAEVDLGAFGALLGRHAVEVDGDVEVVWFPGEDLERILGAGDVVVRLARIVSLRSLLPPFHVHRR